MYNIPFFSVSEEFLTYIYYNFILFFFGLVLLLFSHSWFFGGPDQSHRNRIGDFFAFMPGCVGSFFLYIVIYGFYLNFINPTPEQQTSKAEYAYQEAQDIHAQKFKDAKVKENISKIEAKRLALSRSTKKSHHLAPKSKVKEFQENRFNRSKSEPINRSKSEPINRSKSGPVDEQTQLILSALWLGACFFLQRIFEKLFHDKGYALLTVCAAGFLIAFFTANYFLLGSSVTGGIMGSVGDRA